MSVLEGRHNLSSLNDGIYREVVVSWLEGQVKDGGVTNDTSAFDGEDECHIAHGHGDNRRIGNEGDAYEVRGSHGGGQIHARVCDVETSEPIET